MTTIIDAIIDAIINGRPPTITILEPPLHHGKTGTYSNHHCRCPACTTANRNHQRNYRRRHNECKQRHPSNHRRPQP